MLSIPLEYFCTVSQKKLFEGVTISIFMKMKERETKNYKRKRKIRTTLSRRTELHYRRHSLLANIYIDYLAILAAFLFSFMW